MKTFKEYESVVYIDAGGRLIDTFVVFDTDKVTGLTHINHMNLKVPSETLQLHPATIANYNLPMQDAFSFEIFRKLKEKHAKLMPVVKSTLKAEPGYKLAKAS